MWKQPSTFPEKWHVGMKANWTADTTQRCNQKIVKKKNTRYKFIKRGLTLKSVIDNFRWHLMGSDACDTTDCHHSCHPQDN